MKGEKKVETSASNTFSSKDQVHKIKSLLDKTDQGYHLEVLFTLAHSDLPEKINNAVIKYLSDSLAASKIDSSINEWSRYFAELNIPVYSEYVVKYDESNDRTQKHQTMHIVKNPGKTYLKTLCKIKLPKNEIFPVEGKDLIIRHYNKTKLGEWKRDRDNRCSKCNQIYQHNKKSQVKSVYLEPEWFDESEKNLIIEKISTHLIPRLKMEMSELKELKYTDYNFQQIKEKVENTDSHFSLHIRDNIDKRLNIENNIHELELAEERLNDILSSATDKAFSEKMIENIDYYGDELLVNILGKNRVDQLLNSEGQDSLRLVDLITLDSVNYAKDLSNVVRNEKDSSFTDYLIKSLERKVNQPSLEIDKEIKKIETTEKQKEETLDKDVKHEIFLKENNIK